MSFTYAGQWGPDSMTSSGGAPLPNQSVTVYQSDGITVATIYTDRTKGTTASNPTTTDALGNLQFFAVPGQYVIIGDNGTLHVTVPVDPADVGTGGGSSPVVIDGGTPTTTGPGSVNGGTPTSTGPGIVDGGIPGNGTSVTSVFGRTGAVVAHTGDYTPAQVGAVALGAAVGGDLSGTLPNPTVAKVNGLAVGSSPGGTLDFLRADGTWASPAGGSYVVAPTHSTTPEAHGAVGNTPSHDDSPGIEAAIASVVAACIADGSYACEVVFTDSTVYYANRNPLQNPTINGSASKGYGQITLPYVSYTGGTVPKVTLTLRTMSAHQSMYNFQTVPCSILSTVASTPGYSSTYGIPSVISGPQGEQLGSAQVVQDGSAIDLHMDGVNIMTPGAPYLTAISAQFLQGLRFGTCTISQPSAGYGSLSVSTHPAAIGVIFPWAASDGTSGYDFLGVAGYYCGVIGGEHHDGRHLWLWQNYIGFDPYDPGIGTGGGGIIQLLHMADNVYCFAHAQISTAGAAAIVGNYSPPLVIGFWDLEVNGISATSHIYDSGNNAYITANFQRDPNNYELIITGGQNCKLTDLWRRRGPLSMTVPASGATSQVLDVSSKVIWRDCFVVVSGGSGISIAVNGNSTGLTSGTFVVPSGMTFSLGSYTGTPTLLAISY